tara:strand:- start:530 stop:826 length:297 start_codon:yes stop_codon:yes gene_type:complete
MDNQHRKIKGYRELNQAEIDLMNRIKEQGEVFGGLLSELSVLRNADREATHTAVKREEAPRLTHEQLGESCTAVGLAEDHLKTGVMWLVRAVALPSSF